MLQLDRTNDAHYTVRSCQLLFTSPLTTTSAEFPLGSVDQYPTLFSGFPNGRADKIVVVPSPHSYNLASHYISFEQDLCHCTCGLEVSALAEFYTT